MVLDLETVAAEIGKRHGIKITKDDPVMMMVTTNTMLIQELHHELQNFLADAASKNEASVARYSQDIKAISNKILNEAAQQAQDIINAALVDSKAGLQAAITQSVQTKTANIKAQLEPSIGRARLAANMSLAAACVAILAAGVVLWTSL